MVRYEYKMERISLRTAGREMDKLNSFGDKGFKVIQAVQNNTDLVVLLMKEIETKSTPAKKKEDNTSKKQSAKKDQQDIKNATPTTKEEEEAIADLKAEE